MTVRPGFLVALLVVVLSVAGAAGVIALQQRTDQQALARMQRIAHAVTPPQAAVPSRECHGDGLVACYVSADDSRTVAAAFATRLGRAAGEEPSVSCDPLRHGAAAGEWSCLLAVRAHGRAAIVSVDPHVRAGAHGPEVAGSLIAVSAS